MELPLYLRPSSEPGHAGNTKAKQYNNQKRLLDMKPE